MYKHTFSSFDQSIAVTIRAVIAKELQLCKIPPVMGKKAIFGENDPARRRAAIDEIFTEDCVFYDPSKGVYPGRDEIDRVAGAIRATHPDLRYQTIAAPEELGNGGRVRWVSGRPGEAPAYAGTDFHHCPGRPDCRPLSLFRQAPLSWTRPCDVLMRRIGSGGRNISRSPKLMYRAALRIHKFTPGGDIKAISVAGIGYRAFDRDSPGPLYGRGHDEAHTNPD